MNEDKEKMRFFFAWTKLNSKYKLFPYSYRKKDGGRKSRSKKNVMKRYKNHLK